jgi:hypothetical protein
MKRIGPELPPHLVKNDPGSDSDSEYGPMPSDKPQEESDLHDKTSEIGDEVVESNKTTDMATSTNPKRSEWMLKPPEPTVKPQMKNISFRKYSEAPVKRQKIDKNEEKLLESIQEFNVPISTTLILIIERKTRRIIDG